MAIPAKLDLRGVTAEQVAAEMKRRGLNVEAVAAQERQRRYDEKLKCARDLVYFVRTYCVTYDPRLPEPFVPFDPFPKQEELLRWFDARLDAGEDGVVEKSRDSGVSFLVCYFLLHRWLFADGFAGGLGSRKLEYVDSAGDPKSLFEKLRMTLKNLPPWMLPKGWDWKKHSLEAKLINPERTGSIVGEGGAEIGRGGRTTVYVIDEYNYLENPDKADAALRDNTNCRIYVGTPNGMVGIYEKRAKVPCFRFHWTDDPRKNAQAEDGTYPWYEAQKLRDDPWVIAQEIDIDYLGSGHPRFDREFLMTLYEGRRGKKPLRVEEAGTSAWSATVTTFKDPEPRASYVIVSDVAKGESNDKGDPDWSVSHVYDLETWEQVCHYRGRCDTHAYAIDLAVLGEMYNWAEIAVEWTGVGLATLKTLAEECAYPSIYWHMNEQTFKGNSSTQGFPATQRTKQESAADLDAYIMDMKEGFEGFVWNHENTLLEMIHFVTKPSGAMEAESGFHDDEVTCARMAAYIVPRRTTRARLPGPHSPGFRPKVSGTSRIHPQIVQTLDRYDPNVYSGSVEGLGL